MTLISYNFIKTLKGLTVYPQSRTPVAASVRAISDDVTSAMLNWNYTCCLDIQFIPSRRAILPCAIMLSRAKTRRSATLAVHILSEP
jgi:hypothetical protein